MVVEEDLYVPLVCLGSQDVCLDVKGGDKDETEAEDWGPGELLVLDVLLDGGEFEVIEEHFLKLEVLLVAHRLSQLSLHYILIVSLR